MIHYWTSYDHKALREAKDFVDLFHVAQKVIDQIPNPTVAVSGPISTGGKGSIKENLYFLSASINLLHNKGFNVFDQTPFEEAMKRLREEWGGEGYCMPLLEDFYKPIFESGNIQTMYFLPDWESSFGAKWEYNQCKRLGIEILYFSKEWMVELEK